MIGLAAYFDAENARESIHWHALQLSNVYFSLNETWDPWVFSHLWSLNVVEQFYIFWPLVILFLPRSTSVAITVALLIVPPLLRAFTWNWYDFLPLWAFDPIAAGALLAFFCQSRFVRTVLAVQWGWLPALVILFSPLVLGKEFGGSDIFRLAATAALIVILAGAYHGYRGPFGWFLGNPLFQALSQISYGIYIYHKLVWWLMMQAGDDFFDFSFTTFLVMSALTIVAAQVSWWLVEAPLARLKARFPVHRAVPSDRLRAA